MPEGRDIVRQFAESCSSVGVKLGIYYSVNANEYLNVAGGVSHTSKLKLVPPPGGWLARGGG